MSSHHVIPMGVLSPRLGTRGDCHYCSGRYCSLHFISALAVLSQEPRDPRCLRHWSKAVLGFQNSVRNNGSHVHFEQYFYSRCVSKVNDPKG